MQSELTPQQWDLYNFIKDRGDEWTHAVDIARAVYGFTGDKFIGSGIQRKIAADIQKINDSSVIQKVIMSDRTKGVKLANSEEFDRYIRKEIMAAVRRLMRAKRKAEKGNRDGQMRIVFNSERDTVKAFVDSDKAFGQRLKIARLQANLSQSQAVAAIHEYDKSFDAPMLSRFENGYCVPNKTTLHNLARIYGVTPEYLMTGNLSEETETDEIDGLQVEIRRIN